MAPLKTVISIPRAELNRLCLQFGPLLKLAGCVDSQGEPLIGSQLLVALAGRESSFGAFMRPRFEPAYFSNGYYWRRSDEIKRGCAQYGRAFACSYGPLQILACNAKGYTPAELADSPELAMEASVGFFNRYVIEQQRARTLAAICDVWNTGNWRDGNVPLAYIREVDKHYCCEVIA